MNPAAAQARLFAALAEALPDWPDHYDDAVEAGLDLGLIEPEDLEDLRPLRPEEDWRWGRLSDDD